MNIKLIFEFNMKKQKINYFISKYKLYYKISI